MKYTCIKHFDKIFIEIPDSCIEVDKGYLIYNNTYFEEATEYFSSLGLLCNSACFIENEHLLVLSTNASINVKTLYNLSAEATIKLGCDEEGYDCIIIAIPI